jgi:hypothetical protein
MYEHLLNRVSNVLNTQSVRTNTRMCAVDSSVLIRIHTLNMYEHMLKEDLNAFEYDTRVNVLIEAEYKLK